MCGIAGIIHRDGPGDIGAEMSRMLQSMKHRGPDSSGFALYGPPSDLLVMRIKLADPNEARGFGWSERLERHRNEVEHRLAKIGAMVDVMHGDQEYAYRVTFRYSGELKPLADYMEDVPGCKVLSLGHSLEIVKDLSDAESVAERYRLNGFTGTHAIGHVRMATESDVDISGAHPYWAYPFSDIAVVHNGQLTNYHMWRRRLGRKGHRFQSECADAQAPKTATVTRGADGSAAVFDAAELTTRQINLELRRLVYDEGIGGVTILNPGAKHSIVVGILARCRITIDGSLGYFGCGLIDGPEIEV